METSKIVYVEVTLGRSKLDVLLLLKTVLECCRDEPVVLVDRGPRYNWPLDDLELPCETQRKTWGERLLVEA